MPDRNNRDHHNGEHTPMHHSTDATDAEPASADAEQITLAAVNLKRGGYDAQTRTHDHTLVRTMLAGTPPPDILFLAECTYFDTDEERPLWSLVNYLNRWRAESGIPGSYLPFLSTVEGSKNVPGLLVATDKVEVEAHYRPGKYTRRVHENFVVVRINGVRIWLKSMHWNGALGAHGLSAESALAGAMAKEATLIAGDFNCTSSVTGEELVPDWETKVRGGLRAPWRLRQEGVRDGDQYVQNTAPLDDLLDSGFRDAGQERGDFTTTTLDPLISSRKTRILWSSPLHQYVRFVDYEVLVVAPELLPAGQDHFGVAGVVQVYPPQAARGGPR